METRLLAALVLGLLATAGSHPAVLPGDCPSQLQGTVFLPHETNCNQYYTCQTGSRVLQTCPSEQHFNLALEVCDLPDKAGCQVNPLPPSSSEQRLARQTVYTIFPEYPHHSIDYPVPVYPVYPEYPHHSFDPIPVYPVYPEYPEYPHHSVEYPVPVYPVYPEYPHHQEPIPVYPVYPEYPEYPYHSIDYPIPVYPVYSEYPGYSHYSKQKELDVKSADMQAPPSRAYHRNPTYQGKPPVEQMPVHPIYPGNPRVGTLNPTYYPGKSPVSPVNPTYPGKSPVGSVNPIYPGKPPVGQLPKNPTYPGNTPVEQMPVRPTYPERPVKPIYPGKPPVSPVNPIYPGKPVHPTYPVKPPVGTLPVHPPYPVRPPVSPPRPTRPAPPTTWNANQGSPGKART